MPDDRLWSPLPLPELVALFGTSAEPWWWIAGGYAIELFVGREIREHGDVDVLVLRQDQQRVHDVLRGWDLHAAFRPGELRPWPVGSVLPFGVHDVWCRPTPAAPWRLQVMLDESDGQRWHSRRCPAVHRPVSHLGRTTVEGWPYLAPEVLLFYKGTGSVIREKDEIDLQAVLPLLDDAGRSWLDAALANIDRQHPWRRRLAQE